MRLIVVINSLLWGPYGEHHMSCVVVWKSTIYNSNYHDVHYIDWVDTWKKGKCINMFACVLFLFMAISGWNKAHLAASGEKSFDNDPGWPDIKNDLLPPIPIGTRRAWLREKRETGIFSEPLPQWCTWPFSPPQGGEANHEGFKEGCKEGKIFSHDFLILCGEDPCLNSPACCFPEIWLGSVSRWGIQVPCFSLSASSLFTQTWFHEQDSWPTWWWTWRCSFHGIYQVQGADGPGTL